MLVMDHFRLSPKRAVRLRYLEYDLGNRNMKSPGLAWI